MSDFERSKGFQDLYMSEATRSLLIAEFNADLEIRTNIIGVSPGTALECAGGQLTLLSSGHMLGAVQVRLEERDGRRLGYSGDFHWPIPDVMQVDELVVDSTYGGEDSVRRYSQADAETRFLQLIFDKLKRGSVHIKAHRGTVQRAIQLLSGNVNVPVLASARLCHEVRIYQEYGCAVGPLTLLTCAEGREALKGNTYVRLYSKGDGDPVELKEGTKIVLSAFMNKTTDPVIEYSERGCSVALSNHADFNGTLEYVAATGAKIVVTDNSRGRGIELANAIRYRLGIDARPSTNLESREWGVG
jgi:putative mRNA 3-end processing factor